MLILGIETSTPHSSVCLASNDTILASAGVGRRQRHGEFVVPAIEFCLAQAGVAVADVTGVAVGIGPGLYTGLRVGIVTARTFAAARRLPTVGLCGLDVLAFQVRHVRRPICAAVDARRGELFWAFYRCIPGGVQRATELRTGSPQRLAGEIEASGEECLVVGDGGHRYADVLTGDGRAQVAGLGAAFPDAGHLVEIAIPRFEREETIRPAELEPLYLRAADAKIGWEARGRVRGGTGG